MEEAMKSFTTALFKFIGVLFLVIFSVILGGYVIQTLWGWFIVTTFGLAELSIPKAIGINVLTHFLTHQYVKKDEETYAASAVKVIVYPCMALLVGWIVTLFM